MLRLVRWYQLGRYVRNNPLVIVVIIGVVFGLTWLLRPVPTEHVTLAPQGVSDRFYFGGSRVIGQEFAPPRGLAQIRIPLGTTHEIRGPLILHVRQQLDGPDLRRGSVLAVAGETATFDFTPLINPPLSAFWVLEAPHSTPKSLWAYREKDTTKSVGTAFTGATKIAGNFGYILVQRLPLLLAWFDPTASEAHWNIANVAAWEWQSLLFGALAVALYMGWRRLGRRVWSESVLVGLLIGLSIALHVAFAAHLPLVNDEGAYIQDVLQAKTDFMPLRDYLTKGPVYLVLLKIWQQVIPHAVLAWRTFATVSWAGALAAMWLLCRRLELRPPMRLLVIALMALSPAVVAVTTPLLLQTTSVPIVIWAIVAALKGSQENRRSFIILAAFLITIAFFVRVSSVVGGLVAILGIGYYSRHRWSHLFTYVGAGLLIFLLLFVIAIGTVGWQRSLVAINAEALLISSVRGELAQASGTTEPLVRQLTHEARLFWRGAPLLIIGLFTAPLLLVTRRSLRRSIGVLLGLAGILSVVYYHLRDADYLLPASFALAQPTLLITIFGGMMTLAVAFLTSSATTRERINPPLLFWLPTALVWLALLTFMYVQWGRFRQSYLVEFIPPLGLIGGISLVAGWRALTQIQPAWLSNVLRLTGIFLIAAMLYQGIYMVWQYPHTGSIAQGSLRTFVMKTQQIVPPGAIIFTAQPNVTAFSLRPIVFGNAHPGWYREARLGKIPENLRDLFFVHPNVVTQYLRDEATYVVTERRTNEIYFEGYPERQQLLREYFTKVVSIDSGRGEEPLELYKRTTSSREP